MSILMTPEPPLGEELKWVPEVVSAGGHDDPCPDHCGAPGDVVATYGHLLVVDPGGAPYGGQDPLRLHLHRLHVFHLGQRGLSQLSLRTNYVTNLFVENLLLIRISSQVIQEEGGRGT